MHEHFLDPLVIKNGSYMPPSMPGYSITIKPESLNEYSYPNGEIWNSIKKEFI